MSKRSQLRLATPRPACGHNCALLSLVEAVSSPRAVFANKDAGSSSSGARESLLSSTLRKNHRDKWGLGSVSPSTVP